MTPGRGGGGMTIRLAVIDGHTLTRWGLRQLVAQHDIEIVCECSSAAEARAAVMESRPDVVTIDTVLPDADGLRLARELRDGDADLGIVVLSSDGGDDLLLRAMEAGTSAFVKKTAAVTEVITAIRHAAVAASCFTSSGLPDVLARRRLARERFGLSPREMEVLRLLRNGMSIPAIAGTMFIAQSTAKTYVARLYDKLGAVNRSQALMIAAHHGLIRYEPDQAVNLPTADVRPVLGSPLPERLGGNGRTPGAAKVSVPGPWDGPARLAWWPCSRAPAVRCLALKLPDRGAPARRPSGRSDHRTTGARRFRRCSNRSSGRSQSACRNSHSLTSWS